MSGGRRGPVSGMFVLTLVASVGLFVFVLGLAAFVTRGASGRVASTQADAGPDAGPPPEAAPTTLADDVVLTALAPRREKLFRCFEQAVVTDPSAPSAVRVVLTMVTTPERVRVVEAEGLAGVSFGLKRCLRGVLVDEADSVGTERGTRAVGLRRVDGTVEVELLGDR